MTKYLYHPDGYALEVPEYPQDYTVKAPDGKMWQIKFSTDLACETWLWNFEITKQDFDNFNKELDTKLMNEFSRKNRP